MQNLMLKQISQEYPRIFLKLKFVNYVANLRKIKHCKHMVNLHISLKFQIASSHPYFSEKVTKTAKHRKQNLDSTHYNTVLQITPKTLHTDNCAVTL